MPTSNPYVIPPGGLTPASAWSGPVYNPAAPAPIMLAAKYDPTTGERLSLFKAYNPNFAAVERQFRTKYASGAAVRNDGQKLYQIEKNGDDAVAQITYELQRIMQPFIDDGRVRVEKYVVVAGPTKGTIGQAFVAYRDLSSGQSTRTGIPGLPTSTPSNGATT